MDRSGDELGDFLVLKLFDRFRARRDSNRGTVGRSVVLGELGGTKEHRRGLSDGLEGGSNYCRSWRAQLMIFLDSVTVTDKAGSKQG